ncbi:MAG: hypothetical protein WBA22_04875 [Candidatus Methanofastidiosia archaeon]
MNKTDLAIPIYLDTNTLLDLLASIDEGFSVAEKTTTRSFGSSTMELSGGTEFGIQNVLNLFKINLRGSAARDQQSGKKREVIRYHTYGSLLNHLRISLTESKLIKKIVDEKSWKDISASDFIEARGEFIPNPLIASLQTINRLFGLFFSNVGLITGGMPSQQKMEMKKQVEEFKAIREIFDSIIKDIRHESIQTYVVKLTELTEHRIVVSLFPEYLRDRTGTELPYGEFKLLGKVAKKLDKGNSINLLQGSALSGLGEEVLSPFLDVLKQVGKEGLRFPEVTTEVEAPAMQIIPIAVYI